MKFTSGKLSLVFLALVACGLCAPAMALITTDAATPSAPKTPTVVDANVEAGQPDPMTFTIVTQPPPGQGSASVYKNQLVYTPPPKRDFSGPTSFTFRATDSAGASVVGIASVQVNPIKPYPPANLVAVRGDPAVIDLKWQESEMGPKPAGWDIFRATSNLPVGDPGWGSPLAANLTQVSYADAATAMGTGYFYQVCAKNEVGSGCAVSGKAETATVLAALQSPSITGPASVETGRSYTWTAVQPVPTASASSSNPAIRSQWVLPDGTHAADPAVTYTMKVTDAKTIRYESWFEGFPNSKVGTNFPLNLWTYVWPTWGAAAAASSLYAPATVEYVVQPISDPLTALRGEELTYAFHLPPGATLVSQTGFTAVVRYETAGTQALKATVSDTRGHSTTVTAPVVTVQAPKPLSFGLALVSGDRFNRPPGPVYARTTLTSLPNGDKVAGTTFYVNNEQVGPETTSNAATIALPEPGTYQIKAVMRSANGVTAEAAQSITLEAGGEPTCVLKKSGNGTTSLAFSASCSVQRGVIAKYTWEVNGVPNTVTAASISFPASQINGVRSVKITATSDKGQVGGATFDMINQTSTSF